MQDIFILNLGSSKKARTEMLDNRKHLVVPLVAMKEGIMNNIFYPADKIKAFAESWNGSPVTVNHPEDGNGNKVSANSPDQDVVIIGKLYNSQYSNNQLESEAWIDIIKANKLGYKKVVSKLKDGKTMEVSTGLYSDLMISNQTYNGIPYSYAVKSIRPDHLALLPNDKGACSNDDGCGVFKTNAENEFDTFLEKSKQIGFVTNESSFDDIRKQLSKQIKAIHDNEVEYKYAYVIDVFETYFVYEVSGLPNLKKRDYVIRNDVVTISKDAVDVFAETRYLPVITSNKGEKMDKEKLISGIIANVHSDFGADDKKVLDGMDDALLTKILANCEKKTLEVKANADAAEAKAKAEAEEKKNSEPEKKIDANAQFSDSDIALFNRLKVNEENRVKVLKEDLIKSNKNLTEEILANMEVGAIEALHRGIEKKSDFSGSGGGNPIDVNNEKKARTNTSVVLGNSLIGDTDGKK